MRTSSRFEACSRRLLGAMAAAWALSLSGCSHHADDVPAPTPYPHVTGDLQVTPAYFVGDGTLAPLADGDDCPISLPPQGGHVLLVGAQIEGLVTDTVGIRARLRDPDTDAIVAEEARTVVTRPVPGSTLTETDPETISQVANVAVCPDYAARAIDGEGYVLEVVVTELYVLPQRTASARRSITPRCPTSGPDATGCQCECAGGYTLGTCPISR